MPLPKDSTKVEAWIQNQRDKKLGKKPTEETKRKMGKSHKGQIPWNKGKTNVYCEETLEKMSKVQKGRDKGIPWNEKYGEEKAKQMRKGIIKVHTDNKYNLGRIRPIEERKKISKSLKDRPLSEQTKKKMSEARKGRKVSKKTRNKISETLNGHEVTKETRRKMSKSHNGQAPHNKGKTFEESYGIEKAKELREVWTREVRSKIIIPVKDTKIEVKIQKFLKQLNINYFTHQYINIKHAYQCDILIPSLNMVIETDGDYWHKYPIGTKIDHIRTEELIEKGFKVLRLWECEIKKLGLNEFEMLIK